MNTLLLVGVVLLGLGLVNVFEGWFNIGPLGTKVVGIGGGLEISVADLGLLAGGAILIFLGLRK